MGDKQFNYRLAFWSIVSLGVVATLVHLVHAFQMHRHADTLRQQAQQAAESGQLDQAAVMLKRYLLFAPNDTEALLQYGETLERLPGQPAQRWLAVAAFKQVLARAPNRRGVREHLIALLVELEAFADAREQLEILLVASPKDAHLEERLAYCLEEEGEWEQALKTYEKAIKFDPALIDGYTRLAALRFNHFRQPEAADAVMDDAVEANARNFEAYLARCLYRMGRCRYDDAARDLEQAKQLAPTDTRVLVTAGQLAYERGHSEEARAAWREGLKLHPEMLNMYRGLATLEIAEKRPQEARAFLRQSLEKFPGDADLLHLLMETYLQENDLKSAEQVVAEVGRNEAVPGLADYLRVRILLHRGQMGKALVLLKQMLETDDLSRPLASRTFVCLAECYQHLGENDRCIAAYQQAAVLEPSLVSAHLGLATALLTAGKSEEALAQYRFLARLPRPPENIWLLLGRTLFQRNLTLPPQNREWSEVERALENASQSERLLVPVAILRTDVLLAQAKPDEAAKALAEARDRAADKPELWTALAKLAARRGDLLGAERILADARKQLGERVEWRLAALDLGIGLDGLETKTALLEYEKDLQQFTPDEQLRLLATLADLHQRFGHVEESERLTRELVKRPLDLPAAILILELTLRSREDALQTRLVNELHRLEGEDGTWWRYAEARRQLNRAALGDAKALEEARRLLTDVTRRRPNWGRAALLAALVCEMNHDAAGAVKFYLRAFERGERQLILVFHLTHLLVEQGRFIEADEMITLAQQQLTPRGEFARFAAEIAVRVHQNEHAAALARLATPSDSRDFRHFIWLGQLLARADRRPDAEEALQHAVALRDNRSEPWEALIAFYAQTEQDQQADEALRRLPTKLTAVQTPLALAWGEEALGRWQAAEQHYREAQAKQPSDGVTQQRLAAFYLRLNRPAEAEAALRGLLDPTLRFPRETAAESVAWARRQLALLRAENGGEAGYQEALKLLETKGVHSLADVRAAAFVKATRPDNRAEALRLVESTLKDQPLTADEQWRLAKLYDAQDDWPNAREHWLQLLELDRRNPEHVARFIEAMLARNYRDEARTYLTKLERLEPQSERVKKLQMLLK